MNSHNCKALGISKQRKIKVLDIDFCGSCKTGFREKRASLDLIFRWMVKSEMKMVSSTENIVPDPWFADFFRVGQFCISRNVETGRSVFSLPVTNTGLLLLGLSLNFNLCFFLFRNRGLWDFLESVF